MNSITRKEKRSKVLVSSFIGFLTIAFTIALAGTAPSETTGEHVDPNEHRVVSLAPSHTEILYALGLRHSVVGVTKYCDYPSEVVEDKANGRVKVVGEFIKQDVDKIFSLNPTLVLSCFYEPKELIETLKARGIQTMHFFPKSLQEVFEMMETIGETTGKKDRAYQLTSSYRKAIEEIRTQTEDLRRVSVYFEIHHDGPFAVAELSPVNDIIKIAGGRNIFGDVKEPNYQPKIEEIVGRDPEVILTPMWPFAGENETTTLYEIMVRPGFSITKAVRTGRVIYYDSSLFKRTGPRQVQAIRKLAYLLHPDDCPNPKGACPPWELGKIYEYEDSVLQRIIGAGQGNGL